ncbi:MULTISPECIES: universal stress protein [Arthrobacter]|uniref:Universal stress protein n=1 Tax=Arthrobacter caoxuetaonis TaxID=2886935 RepID=A0A9X1MDR2_9MICC|nr:MULTISPECIES: universal stress protein [Arthrobacter]MCC3281944.1 universal stress protein [Arthrobacter caoxuetaonis]MCC3283017.1 universal stress protein [Arthrobacter caoxuetaonis]MCC3298134.1 universal stress protein [Arthrobacter caoxuetaonis]MCC9192055.1 universal stress protein [Arthrobacter sp. zg-Y916]USQ57141.1 universal stress protein [Arthrobacter caoxuetaonis]
MTTNGRKLIVVGVDSSALSIVALQTARRLAELLQCRIEAVTVWSHPIALTAPVASAEWSPRVDAEEALNESILKAFGDDVPEGLTKLAVSGQPVQVLVEASRNAEMLVVGSRGRGGFAGLLLGSVSSAAAAHAHCPVLIVHPPEKE